MYRSIAGNEPFALAFVIIFSYESASTLLIAHIHVYLMSTLHFHLQDVILTIRAAEIWCVRDANDRRSTIFLLNAKFGKFDFGS